ncbi:MAG: hypothetical protein IJI14_09915 [Anaerolineaceae bacterium]|nr:hypothetical protein [Anaerolineaceae bacterium]
MNTNNNSLIDNSFFESGHHNAFTGNDFSEVGVKKYSAPHNDKLIALANNENRNDYTETDSNHSPDLLALISGLALIVSTFLPFLKVNILWTYLELNLLNSQYFQMGWLVIVCGIIGSAASLFHKKGLEIIAGSSAVILVVLSYYFFSDGGNEYARAASRLMLEKGPGFYTALIAGTILAVWPFFSSEDQ